MKRTLWQRNLPNVMCLILTWAYGKRYPKQLKHLLCYGRVDDVSTFDVGRCFFVSWVLTQLWRPPVLSKTIAMVRKNTQTRGQPFAGWPRTLWGLQATKKNFLGVQLNHLGIHTEILSLSDHVRIRSPRNLFFDKEQTFAMITWLFLFLGPLTPVSADP